MNFNGYSPLEQLAGEYGGAVEYDRFGTPSIYQRLYRVSSAALASALPDHAHPAFVLGDEVRDVILIGRYEACELAEAGPLHTLAHVPPAAHDSYDGYLARMRASGATGLTIADHGLLVLIAHHDKLNPKGNTARNCSHKDGTPWEPGAAVTAGTVRVYHGAAYTCKVSHTTAAENRPDVSRAHWTQGRFVGGAPSHYKEIGEDTGWQGWSTITGSGPMSWYMDGNAASLCDVVGNVSECVYGMRLVRGEIQILAEDNFAASPEAKLGADGAWKAILPGADGSCSLVSPGTAGTVHYTVSGGKIVLDTVEPDIDDSLYATDFKSIGSNLASVPVILYELGLAPLPGTTVEGRVYITLTDEELVPRRGGCYIDGNAAGIAALDFTEGRETTASTIGARMRTYI